MNREVCSAESKSVDPMKMKIIQTRTGSQYLKNERTENETTERMVVLISRRDGIAVDPAARVRADLHGTGLGRAPAGIPFPETIAAGSSSRGIVGDRRPAGSAKRRPRGAVPRSDIA